MHATRQHGPNGEKHRDMKTLCVARHVKHSQHSRNKEDPELTQHGIVISVAKVSLPGNKRKTINTHVTGQEDGTKRGKLHKINIKHTDSDKEGHVW